jgi:hypothetical protein
MDERLFFSGNEIITPEQLRAENKLERMRSEINDEIKPFTAPMGEELNRKLDEMRERRRTNTVVSDNATINVDTLPALSGISYTLRYPTHFTEYPAIHPRNWRRKSHK